MTSKAERILSSSLRTLIAELPNGANIPESEEFRDILAALEYFVPRVLAERHTEWKFTGLDQIVAAAARKTGSGEIELFGVCCFVSDQTLTPIHLHFQLAKMDDEVAWMECRLGEQGENGMKRAPYERLRAMTNRIANLEWSVEAIDWVYKVTFGDRQS